MERPSRDQRGMASMAGCSVKRRRGPPRLGTTYTSDWPAWVDSKTIHSPSGDHRGVAVVRALVNVSLRGFPPSRSESQMSDAPVLVEWKAIWRPSGEYC